MNNKKLGLFLLTFSVFNLLGTPDHDLFQKEIEEKTQKAISEMNADEAKECEEESFDAVCSDLKRQIVNLSIILNLLQSSEVSEKNKASIRDELSHSESDEKLSLYLKERVSEFAEKCMK